jgi:hypothetical protein
MKKYPRMDSSRLIPAWSNIHTGENKRSAPASVPLPAMIRGMNYHTGQNWYRNFHDLTRHRVSADLEEMRAMGITTIRRYGPGIYDHNVLILGAANE